MESGFSTCDWVTIARALEMTHGQMVLVRAMMDGQLSPKQAAAEIGIAASTAHNQLNRLYRKLDIHSRHELQNLVWAVVQRERETSKATRQSPEAAFDYHLPGTE